MAGDETGIRCTTIQTLVWPVDHPTNGTAKHSAYGKGEQLIPAAQTALKTCSEFLGKRFDKDWQAIGIPKAPFPQDEFGARRPPMICTTIYKDRNLYECEKVMREKNPDQESILVLEKEIIE